MSRTAVTNDPDDAAIDSSGLVDSAQGASPRQRSDRASAPAQLVVRRDGGPGVGTRLRRLRRTLAAAPARYFDPVFKPP